MKKTINLAVIGLGGRGIGLMETLLRMNDVNIIAVCDVYDDRNAKATKLVEKAKGNIPFTTKDYNKIIEMDAVDTVLIATSWQYHVKIACDSMKAGKFTAMEVGGTYDIDDCYKLVSVFEKTKTPFMFLENCCYGNRELMCLNMARTGVLGDIIQCNGAYCHDLREEIANGKENRHYRLEHYINYNCENYPTHDLGPIAKILGINRGNRMTKLMSVASMSKGLHQYVLKNKADDKELASVNFAQADIVTTIIKCENGEIIRLTLETTLPRNYSRGFEVNGTKGMYQEDGDAVFIDEITKNQYSDNIELEPWHMYHNAKEYEQKYGNLLWTNPTDDMKKSGHGGMDYLVLRAMVHSAKGEMIPTIDVYDAASWMCITALSKQSIENSNAWVDIPDFTNGAYKTRSDKSCGKYCLD